MKNSTSLKSKAETPKTPGGISKSLLTPCRRVGLSRNWRKTVASPFNSPLANSQVEQSSESRKRKEILEDTPRNDSQEEENIGTPVRKVVVPRHKKSKTFLKSISNIEDDCFQPELESPVPSGKVEECKSKNEIVECPKLVATPVRLKSKSKSRSSLKISDNEAYKDTESKASGRDTDAKESPLESVNTPISLKSKSRIKRVSPKINSSPKDINTNSICPTDNKVRLVEDTNNMQIETTSTKINKDLNNTENDITNKDKTSPNNLTKECFVVIQNKIFKKQLQENEIKGKTDDKVNTVSQALFNDSDSDDVPLNNLTKSEILCDNSSKIDDDDFASQPKLKKTKSKTTQKEKSTIQPKSTLTSKESLKPHKPQVTATSQSSIDDDDDFFEKKKTIIIRKSYDKVVKPLKAKSTGSITQKDVEDLKARIETKKKMLLAKSMTDTKELRELIKKWQKGCQDALLELMDLMKNKCPDQHMEYSQILQSLKIPASLVGYDSDNDCFVTPEDENIILSHL